MHNLWYKVYLKEPVMKRELMTKAVCSWAYTMVALGVATWFWVIFRRYLGQSDKIHTERSQKF